MTDAYTRVTKPTGTGYTNVAKPSDADSNVILKGMATGLLIPPTYAKQYRLVSTIWNKVSKPSGSSYTNVAKPTT
jgi:preprotein translocase subunit Sss1